MGAYDNFLAALSNKSLETRRTYEKSFNGFLRYTQQQPHVLITLDQKELQHRIKEYLESMKAIGLSYSMANKAYWAIRMFFSANEIMLNWDWINHFKPKEGDKEQRDRPYSHEEISNMMAATDDYRTITALLIMASGGLRKGALPGIRIDKDLIWLHDYDLYAIHVYPLDANNHYYTFITPQASNFIDAYKDGRKSGFLFINKRDNDLPVSDSSIVSDIWDVAVKSGVRTPKADKERHQVQLDHGLRKFFRTTLENCGIHEVDAERLMGHGKKLVKTYSMPTVVEWMHTCKYYNAIQSLTF